MRLPAAGIALQAAQGDAARGPARRIPSSCRGALPATRRPRPGRRTGRTRTPRSPSAAPRRARAATPGAREPRGTGRPRPLRDRSGSARGPRAPKSLHFEGFRISCQFGAAKISRGGHRHRRHQHEVPRRRAGRAGPAARRPPRPRRCAPKTKKGTSAPSCAPAPAGPRRPSPVPHSRFSTMSVVAASELPPPRPPPIGRRLSTSMSAPSARAASPAAAAGRPARTGRPPPARPADRSRAGSRRPRARRSRRRSAASMSAKTVCSRW